MNPSLTPLPPPFAAAALLQPVIPPAEQWKKKYPSIISGILAFLQFGITVVIIGCEVGSVLIDMVTSTIYVGFWAGTFFTFAWVSLAGSACCCRFRGCAIYTLIIQCISLFFAACVIGFDSYYLANPSTCFFPTSVCKSNGTTRGLFYSKSNFQNIKTPLIIGQLAAGGVMFFLCLIYVVIFVVTLIRVHKAKSTPNVFPQAPYALPTVPPLPTGPDGMILAPAYNTVRPTRVASPLYHRPAMIVDNGDGRANDLLCPTCSTMMAVSVKKRPPQ